MTRGNHQLQFGVNWMHSLQNVYGPLNADGNFTFSGATTGLSMADFLLGDASAFTQGGIQFANERYTYFGAYAQDTWKVTPRLTVNLGLRWEPYFGNTMSNGHVGHFYPDLFTSGVHSTVYPNGPPGYLFAGDSQFDTNGRPAHAKLNDFAPRVGIAWDPTGSGKTSIRASWGIFYDLPHTLFAYGFSQEPPWGTSITRSGTAAAPISFSNPWAGAVGGNPFPLADRRERAFPGQPQPTPVYPLDLKITYLEQWNVSLQRQLGNWLFSASYLGNNTLHLWSDDPINAPLVTGATSAVTGPPPAYLAERRCGARITASFTSSIPAERPATTPCCFRRSIAWRTTLRCWEITPGRIASPIHLLPSSTARNGPILPAAALTAATASASITATSSMSRL